MIKTNKELEMVGDLNPTKSRIPIIGFPKEVERQLIKLEKIKSECLEWLIDSGWGETQEDWSSPPPMSSKEQMNTLNILYLELTELYFKIEKHLVNSRDNHKEVQ